MRETWQKNLNDGYASGAELLEFLGLESEFTSAAAELKFATKVPKSFAKRMLKKDSQDPLLLQVLASFDEELEFQGYENDPLQEAKFNILPGLIHKYKKRVLLIMTGNCAINCRYCFRRNFSYNANNPGRSGWEEVWNYIANNPVITEVILSGGDPLILSDNNLAYYVAKITKLTNIKILRIHTRMPVVLPSRITKEFLELFSATAVKKVMVLHINHPQEINNEIIETAKKLQSAGFTLLNQSVLLKNINNNASILENLSYKLFAAGIMPYYLHVPDKIRGTKHFDISLSEACAIHRELHGLLPGYLLPKLAQEIPNKAGKTLL